jgi:hypothetical protein
MHAAEAIAAAILERRGTKRKREAEILSQSTQAGPRARQQTNLFGDMISTTDIVLDGDKGSVKVSVMNQRKGETNAIEYCLPCYVDACPNHVPNGHHLVDDDGYYKEHSLCCHVHEWTVRIYSLLVATISIIPNRIVVKSCCMPNYNYNARTSFALQKSYMGKKQLGKQSYAMSLDFHRKPGQPSSPVT